MLNKVTLIGHLGRDPDVRSLNDGSPVVNLSIATSETWRDKATGEKRERTEWHRVVIFNENLARIAGQYLRKGSKVYLEGKLQTRKWQDQSGADRYSTEVVLQGFGGRLIMLGDPASHAGNAAGPGQYGQPPAAAPAQYGAQTAAASPDQYAAPPAAPPPAPAQAQPGPAPYGPPPAAPAGPAAALDDEIPF